DPFLLRLPLIPALTFRLERPTGVNYDLLPNADIQPAQSTPSPILSSAARQTILVVLLAAIGLQAIYFQSVYRREGRERGWVFDADYKELYDAAVALPKRPIYLSDGTEPAYEHAYWYAAVEGRKVSEFVHLDEGTRAP